MNVKRILLVCVYASAAIALSGEWTPSRFVAIDYPLLGVQSDTAGVVKIECNLRDNGLVDTARVKSGSVLLGRHALKSVASWRFRYEGVAASGDSRVAVLIFEFKLTKAAPGPPTSRFEYVYPDRFIITSNRLLRTH